MLYCRLVRVSLVALAHLRGQKAMASKVGPVRREVHGHLAWAQLFPRATATQAYLLVNSLPTNDQG